VSALALAAPPSDAALRGALEPALARAGLGAPRALRRRPSEYRTSFPLEVLELDYEAGQTLKLAFKQLDWDRLDEGARLAKPEFLHDPAREPAVYAALADLLAGPPRYFGAVVEAERHWLFVEWVEGRELYQVGELELWCAAASWLGEMHETLLPHVERLAGAAPLLEHDAAYHRRWLRRAIEFRGDGSEGRGIARLEECHEAVVEGLATLPRTLIHGEFYASNVLVAGTVEPRIAPVDWELAAIGPGLTDLAALVSGGWEEEQRIAIVAAYADGLGSEVAPKALDFARLQLAIQWLGWAPPEWEPPEGQRHDWLAEAFSLVEKLGL